MLTVEEYYRIVEPAHRREVGLAGSPVRVLDVDDKYRASSGMQWELAWDGDGAGPDAEYVPGQWLSQAVAGEEHAGLVRVRAGDPLVLDASGGGSLEALPLSARLAGRLVRAHPDTDNTPGYMPVPSPIVAMNDYRYMKDYSDAFTSDNNPHLIGPGGVIYANAEPRITPPPSLATKAVSFTILVTLPAITDASHIIHYAREAHQVGDRANRVKARMDLSSAGQTHVVTLWSPRHNVTF
ncbi:MAG: hypothetical protein ABF966_09075 [Bifidobacterium psychraerophilum]|uniref:hypothetical protein n=1 Tax=Bifidobacterium psychraerophilum TaxID=218140 RepID=UPI0039E79CEF